MHMFFSSTPSTMATYRNRSIDRGLDLLEALRDARTGIGLTELAAKVELDLATAFRLLAVLTERKYVHHDLQSRRYSLGYASFRLAQPDHLLRTVRRMAQQFLKRVAVDLGVTVQLGELHGTRWCIYAEGKGLLPSPYGVRIGGFLDAHATAMGKMLLAQRPVREVEALFQDYKLTSHTSSTLTQPERLGKELRQISLQGFALEMGEFKADVHAVAVPIVPPAGGVRFAISSAIQAKLSAQQQRVWIEKLLMASREIADYVIQT